MFLVAQYYFDRVTAKQKDATKVEISGYLKRYGPSLPPSGKRITIYNLVTNRTKTTTTNNNGWFGVYFFSNELNAGNNIFLLTGVDATLTKTVRFTPGTGAPPMGPPIAKKGNLFVSVRTNTPGATTYGASVRITGPVTQTKTYRTGWVYFKNIPTGTYDIIVSKTGFETKRSVAMVSPYTTSRETITINKKPVKKGVLTLEVRAPGIMANAIGAKISIYKSGTRIKVAEKTNYVTLTKFTLDPGTYDIIVTKTGYEQPGIKRVDIPEGKEVVEVITIKKKETTSAARYPTNIYTDIPGVKLTLTQNGSVVKTLTSTNPLAYVTSLATKASFLGTATLTENKKYTATLTHTTIPSVSKKYTFTFNKAMYYKGIYLPLGIKCMGKLKANITKPTIPVRKQTPEKLLLNLALEPVPGAPAPEKATIEVYVDTKKVTEINVSANKPKQPDILPSIITKFDPVTFFRSSHVIMLHVVDTPCNITPSTVTLTLPALAPGITGVCEVVADTINYPRYLDFSMPLEIRNPRINCSAIKTRGIKILATFKLGPYVGSKLVEQGEDVVVDLAEFLSRTSGQDILSLLNSIHSTLSIELSAVRPGNEPVPEVKKLTKIITLADRPGLRTELKNLSAQDITQIQSAAQKGLDEVYALLAQIMMEREVPGYVPPTAPAPKGLCKINPKINLPQSFNPASPNPTLRVEISNAMWTCPDGSIVYPSKAYIDTPAGTIEVPLTNGVGRIDLADKYIGDLWKKPIAMTTTGTFEPKTIVEGAPTQAVVAPTRGVATVPISIQPPVVSITPETTPPPEAMPELPIGVPTTPLIEEPEKLPEAYEYAEGQFTVNAIDASTGASLSVPFRINGYKGFTTPASFTFGSIKNNVYDWKQGIINPDRTYTITLDNVPDTYEPVGPKYVTPSKTPSVVFELKPKTAGGAPVTIVAHKEDGTPLNIQTALNYVTPITDKIKGVKYVKRTKGTLTPLTIYLEEGRYKLTPITSIPRMNADSVTIVIPRDAGKTIDIVYKDMYSGGEATLNITTNKPNIVGYASVTLNGKYTVIHKGKFPASIKVPISPGTRASNVAIRAYELSPTGKVLKSGMRWIGIGIGKTRTEGLPRMNPVSPGCKRMYRKGPKKGQFGQCEQVDYEEQILMP